MNPGNSKLDRKLGPVCAQCRQLHTLPQDRTVARCQIPRQALSMALSQLRRNEDLTHVAAEDVHAAMSERLLSSRIEIDDAAQMVHRDDAIESGIKDGCPLRFGRGDNRWRRVGHRRKGPASPVSSARARKPKHSHAVACSRSVLRIVSSPRCYSMMPSLRSFAAACVTADRVA